MFLIFEPLQSNQQWCKWDSTWGECLRWPLCKIAGHYLRRNSIGRRPGGTWPAGRTQNSTHRCNSLRLHFLYKKGNLYSRRKYSFILFGHVKTSRCIVSSGLFQVELLRPKFSWENFSCCVLLIFVIQFYFCYTWQKIKKRYHISMWQPEMHSVHRAEFFGVKPRLLNTRIEIMMFFCVTECTL